MDYRKLLEENLREAACLGDIETLKELILKGVDVNSKNDVNGWTALHWAARRNNVQAVCTLLNSGADIKSMTHLGVLPCDLTSCEKIKNLLGKEGFCEDPLPPGTFKPNYLKNPPIFCSFKNNGIDFIGTQRNNITEGLILKLRVADSLDFDFIEVELLKSELFFEKLKNLCCKELGIEPSEVFKIRKLPNTIIRNDKDVQRLKDFEELEVLKLKT